MTRFPTYLVARRIFSGRSVAQATMRSWLHSASRVFTSRSRKLSPLWHQMTSQLSNRQGNVLGAGVLYQRRGREFYLQ